MRLDGLHHITAVTQDAQANLDFYTGVLGLRLGAKAVNQDSEGMYHLFYGDEHASPGSQLTFFEARGSSPGVPGPGMVHRIVWRVGSHAALNFWQERLGAQGVELHRTDTSLRFSDPDGLSHEFIVEVNDEKALTARHPEIPQESAIVGLAGVRAYSENRSGTARVLQILGATHLDDSRWELRGDQRSSWIAFDSPPANRPWRGHGTVHHIAWSCDDSDDSKWLLHLQRANIGNSGIIDRHYFRSIYFREPGGVLCEISTHGPGFTVDTPVDALGRKVLLPPWMEGRRGAIEARLAPLPDPRAAWAREIDAAPAAAQLGRV